MMPVEEQKEVDTQVLDRLRRENAYLAGRIAQDRSSVVVQATMTAIRNEILASRLGVPMGD